MRLALLLARGGDPALKVDDFAALFQKVGLRNDILGGQRLHHLDLPLGDARGCPAGSDGRRRFAGIAPAPGRRSH